METTKGKFEPPSNVWKWVLYPMITFSIVSFLFYTFAFIGANPANLKIKIKLIASIFSLFTSAYLLLGYRYLLWATAAKNKLIQLSKDEPHIIQYQFGRYFINEKFLDTEHPHDRWFKRLQQTEIQEVFEMIKTKTSNSRR